MDRQNCRRMTAAAIAVLGLLALCYFLLPLPELKLM